MAAGSPMSLLIPTRRLRGSHGSIEACHEIILGLDALDDRALRVHLGFHPRQNGLKPRLVTQDVPARIPPHGIVFAPARIGGPLQQVQGVPTLTAFLSPETGAAVVIIEHDIPLVTAVSDELVALELGRVVATGSPGKVIRHPAVVEGYLGSTPEAIRRSGRRRKAGAARRPAGKQRRPSSKRSPAKARSSAKRKAEAARS